MILTKTIERILRDNEPIRGVSPRDSDKVLNIQVLKALGIELSSHQEYRLMEINYTSVLKIRQKFQQQGKYLPSPEVARERKLKGYEVEQVYPQVNPEQLEKKLEFDQPKAVSWLNDDE